MARQTNGSIQTPHCTSYVSGLDIRARPMTMRGGEPAVHLSGVFPVHKCRTKMYRFQRAIARCVTVCYDDNLSFWDIDPHPLGYPSKQYRYRWGFLLDVVHHDMIDTGFNPNFAADLPLAPHNAASIPIVSRIAHFWRPGGCIS